MFANLGVESGQGPSNPTLQFGAESSPGPSNPTVQIGLGAGNPQDHVQRNWANPFQGHANQPWGQGIDPSSVFESQLQLLRQSAQHTAASDTEPGKLESHAYQHESSCLILQLIWQRELRKPNFVLSWSSEGARLWLTTVLHDAQ